MKDVNINVEHITRVEGHGNIVVNAAKGKLEKVMWEVPEAPRYFEAFVKGKPYHQLAPITARICGICSIGHALASLKATEQALGIQISEQDILFRKLALHGENMQSHVLHVGYLALPDMVGAGSVIPLVSSNPDEVKTVIRLHRLANDMSRLMCGRTTHPRRLIPGGFSKIPSYNELEELKERLGNSVEDLQAVASFVKSVASALPDFNRETEFISLVHDKEYPFYDGDVISSDGGKTPPEEYLSITNEFVVPQSTAKYTKNKRESYMVGALARFNNNYDRLSPMAKEVAKDFGLSPVCHNPYMNNIAQLVEIVHSVEDSIALIDEIFDRGIEEQGLYHIPDIKPKAGNGVGAVEVPRGILFHEYTYDDKGICTKANCIIPTNQNHANIQLDMEKLVPEILDKTEKEIELTLEMLVRAYDPCISCSTHYVDVKFVK